MGLWVRFLVVCRPYGALAETPTTAARMCWQMSKVPNPHSAANRPAPFLRPHRLKQFAILPRRREIFLNCRLRKIEPVTPLKP